MADRGDSIPERLGRIRARLGQRSSDGNDDDDSFWEHLLPLLGVAAGLVSIDAVWAAASRLPDRAGDLARGGGAVLADVLPVLVGVTLLAVLVCVAVVAHSVRNL